MDKKTAEMIMKDPYIGSLANLFKVMPPEIAVMLDGPTGVGKSSFVAMLAAVLDLPLMDIRPALMTEGDVRGLPNWKLTEETGVASFAETAWFDEACKRPVVLMIDEINQASTQVQAMFFQLILDRCLGDSKGGFPRFLHPETRIFTGINLGKGYAIQAMSEALKARFARRTYLPPTESMIHTLKVLGMDPWLVEFLEKAESTVLHQDPNGTGDAKMDRNAIRPNPRAWARLDRALKHANLSPSNFEVDGSTAPVTIQMMAEMFVGTSVASTMFAALRNSKRNVDISFVFKRDPAIFARARERKITQNDLVFLAGGLRNHLVGEVVNAGGKKPKIHADKMKAVADFMTLLGVDQRIFLMESSLRLLTSGKFDEISLDPTYHAATMAYVREIYQVMIDINPNSKNREWSLPPEQAREYVDYVSKRLGVR